MRDRQFKSKSNEIQPSPYYIWRRHGMEPLSAFHYGDVIMGEMASQIISLVIVYSTVYSDADQSKHQSSASLAFVWGIHRGPVNSPHKWLVTRKMFPFDDVIMQWYWPCVGGIYLAPDILLTKFYRCDHWCLLCCWSEQAVEQKVFEASVFGASVIYRYQLDFVKYDLNDVNRVYIWQLSPVELQRHMPKTNMEHNTRKR